MPVALIRLPSKYYMHARQYCRLIIVVLLWLSPSSAIAISGLSLKLGHIEFQGITAEEVSIEIDTGPGDSVALVISAAKIAVTPGHIVEQFRLNCDDAELVAMVISCDKGTYYAFDQQYGDIRGGLSLNYDLNDRAGHITLANIKVGAGNIGGSLEFTTENWHADLHASNLDLPSLRKIAEMFTLWPADYTEESGVIDADISIEGGADGIQLVQGHIHADTIGFIGANAAEQLSGRISFSVRPMQVWQTSVEGNLDSGVLFIDSGINLGTIRPGFILEITEQPLHFSFDLSLDRAQQQIAVQRMQLDHPGVMTTTMQVDAGWQEGLEVRNAELDLSVHDAGEFYTTYLQPFLLDTQFNNLLMDGIFEADAQINTSGIMLLDMQFSDLDTYDKNGRFNLAGLNGTFRITDTLAPVLSTMTWQNAGLYRLQFGAGRLILESSEQAVKIVSWDDVPILDGQLQINSLSMTNPGKADMQITFDGALTPVSMNDFTGLMGWPVMSGELTAAIDGLTYSQGMLEVDGQINLGLFDGNVYIRNLRIQDLFGLVPSLYADIDIDMLDLELLTNRFTFGQIQGHISGKVHELELQAWEPVYFEAELATPKDDTTRHRISQKAVENLGYIGGGAGGALSGGFLRIFKHYSYGRMGISCRLYNGSCEMGGVGTTPDGFIIVSRGGLFPPWIEVKGTGHSIDWTTLIEGLKTITTNQPEFE